LFVPPAGCSFAGGAGGGGGSSSSSFTYPLLAAVCKSQRYHLPSTRSLSSLLTLPRSIQRSAVCMPPALVVSVSGLAPTKLMVTTHIVSALQACCKGNCRWRDRERTGSRGTSNPRRVASIGRVKSSQNFRVPLP